LIGTNTLAYGPNDTQHNGTQHNSIEYGKTSIS
jgi:hypothetical protein